MAVRFDYIDIHPEIWTKNVPLTSASCHLFLKAIQLLERHADFDTKNRQLVEGSPTFVINEGRLKPYGNVGYRIVEASINELLANLSDLASWC